ncbi:hypothetical protein K435DRAFT_875991 [Dendrothele bispora CBS 962.96]|uniref:Uncharacterized protein n=1 Tax=Dendrothele bispora (strain CBS 962.96) TaxID=1314807 RepID=A0A4S8KT41_DENBC|nr:hypothetical protein K435DRAFT_875991 [Dendrothele bispora CBS 962.96]
MSQNNDLINQVNNVAFPTPPNDATWYQSVIAGLTTEAQNAIGQAQLFNSDHGLWWNISNTINNLNNQLNCEITELRTPGGGGAARMNLPENFSADRARLLITLSRLTGTPSIQFKDLAEQVTNDQVRYTWTEFKRKLSGVYGRYDEKLTTKQELDKLAKNTAKAEKDFLTYAEEFRTLAGIAEYSD